MAAMHQPQFLSRRGEDYLAQKWFEIDVFFEGIREPIEQCFPLPAVMRLLLGERRQSFGRSELVQPASPPGTASQTLHANRCLPPGHHPLRSVWPSPARLPHRTTGSQGADAVVRP